MLPTRVVVVVLPAEPVMPIVLQGTTSMKICESFERGMPRLTASATMDNVSGTPPERQSTSVESSNSSGCPPSAHVIGYSASESRATRKSASVRMSLKVTRAPCKESQRAKAKPCRAAPSIKTRVSVQFVFISPSNYQSNNCQANADHGGKQADQPK